LYGFELKLIEDSSVMMERKREFGRRGSTC
jgi:hypothetical protein